MNTYFIGLMSGTSVDGVDAVLVEFEPAFRVVAAHHQPFDTELQKAILTLATQTHWPRDLFAQVDVQLAQSFAEAVNRLLILSKIKASEVEAIGSHGQTIFHATDSPYPNSIQIGDANMLQAETGIPVVYDFRRKDIAHGGQGAPLVPVFHRYLLANETPRVVLNLGGIANVSILQPGQDLIGFDTGPGNTLMDAYCRQHGLGDCDVDGALALKGQADAAWLEQVMQCPYFQIPPPKSTGRELFHLAALPSLSLLSPEDALSTLTLLTAKSIAQALLPILNSAEMIVCGGGLHNAFLMQSLQKALPDYRFVTLEAAVPGCDPDQIEAMAFAYLAYCYVNGMPSNVPSVTGADREIVLGCLA